MAGDDFQLLKEAARQHHRRVKAINRRLYIQPKDWQQIEKKRLLREALRLRDFRISECTRLNITMQEYEARLSSWRYLRQLMEERRDRIKAREDSDRLMHMMKAKTSAKAARKAQLVLEGIEPPPPSNDLKELREQFGS